MKKKFIPGSDIKEKPVEEKQQELDLDVAVSASPVTIGMEDILHVTHLRDIVEAPKGSIEDIWGAPHVTGVSELLPAKEVVSKGEKLIVEALLASLELQVQAERVPSIYKNKLNKEIKRIRDELRK